MINASCFTNLDDERRLEWPRVFVAVPQPGEMVESLCGKRILRVVRVTHIVSKSLLFHNDTPNGYPGIRVELNR